MADFPGWTRWACRRRGKMTRSLRLSEIHVATASAGASLVVENTTVLVSSTQPPQPAWSPVLLFQLRVAIASRAVNRIRLIVR